MSSNNNQMKVVAEFSEDEDEGQNTFGRKLADIVTHFSGTWYFVVYSTVFLGLWILLQIVLAGMAKAFDPYPFILLNLVISVVCMLQTPIILIVQKRYDDKDRERAKHTNALVRKLDREIGKLKRKEVNDENGTI